MGLCKCPKRQLTTLFCYEHRVNVCQSCIVQSHPKCVVQSYLKWLQDSDYTPICSLCEQQLNTSECVRLVCYHVYHWHCLDAYARNLPPTTAPAGYKCPSCSDPILPASNMVSPVASALREKISSVNWARVGLGLPAVTEDAPVTPLLHPNVAVNASSRKMSIESNDTVVHVDNSLTSRPDETAGTSRRLHGLTTDRLLLVDDDESKYRRRYAVVRFPFWLKSAANSMNILKRGRRSTCKLVVVGIALFCCVCVFLAFLGRIASSDKPELDPHNNPLIHNRFAVY